MSARVRASAGRRMAPTPSGGPLVVGSDDDASWVPCPARLLRYASGLRPRLPAAASLAEMVRRNGSPVDVADPLGGSPIAPEIHAVLRRSAGRGSRLPAGAAGAAGAVLGTDLSSVRLHTDAEADRLARSVQSVAFTHGPDIYFSRGTYAPHTTDGAHLLGHELAHVAQRDSGGPGTIGRADDAAEASADRTALTVAPALRRSMYADPPGASAPEAVRTGSRIDGGVRRSVLRRRLSATSADIAATRNEKAGLAKLTGAKDGLDKIGKLLDLHAGLTDQAAQIPSLQAICALIERWLKQHKSKKDAAIRALLEDVGAEAKRDLGQALAQQRYLNDLRAAELTKSAKLAHQKTTTPFSQQLTPNLVHIANTTMLASGEEQTEGTTRKETADVIRAANLTEAELTAVKMFTAQDFMYINPATAGDSDWMTSQLGRMEKAADTAGRLTGRRPKIDVDALHAEGATHAGVLMQAMDKMERKRGRVYRGARLSPAEFATIYGAKTEITYNSFVSTAINTSTPEAYARGEGALRPRADQTVSISCILEVDDARDVQALSETRQEEEWMLLPGATFDITRIEDKATGHAGTPPATAWKVVHLKQRAPKKGAAGQPAPGGPVTPPGLTMPGKMPPLPRTPARAAPRMPSLPVPPR